MSRDIPIGKLIAPSKEVMEECAREIAEENEREYQRERKEIFENPNRYYGETFACRMRILIGKTSDITVHLCLHNAIIAREMQQIGTEVCRVCNKGLDNHDVPRINDHYLFMHPDCGQPICADCARDKPDEFHQRYQEAWKLHQQLFPDLKEERIPQPSIEYTLG